MWRLWKDWVLHLWVFLLCPLFLLPVGSTAQVVDKQEGCLNIREISIPFTKETLSRKQVKGDDESRNVVNYDGQDRFTFWYKLTVKTKCKLRFSVHPSSPEDMYDVTVYQYNGGNLCKALVEEELEPMEGVFYEQSQFFEQPENLLTNIHMEELIVEPEDVFYVSVFNLSGKDCGHRFRLEACGKEMVFNSIKKDCFEFFDPDLNPVFLEPEEEKDSESKPVTIRGTIKDKDTGEELVGDVTFKNLLTGEKVTVVSGPEVGYKLSFPKGTRLGFECKSVGYKEISGQLEVLRPSVYEFNLLKE